MSAFPGLTGTRSFFCSSCQPVPCFPLDPSEPHLTSFSKSCGLLFVGQTQSLTDTHVLLMRTDSWSAVAVGDLDLGSRTWAEIHLSIHFELIN